MREENRRAEREAIFSSYTDLLSDNKRLEIKRGQSPLFGLLSLLASLLQIMKMSQ